MSLKIISGTGISRSLEVLSEGRLTIPLFKSEESLSESALGDFTYIIDEPPPSRLSALSHPISLIILLSSRSVTPTL